MTLARVPFHTRLYVWSVIFEPLFFFVLFEDSVVGITGNLSRLLQMAVVVVLAWRLLLQAVTPGGTAHWEFPAPQRPLYRYFVAMFVLAVVAGVIGAMQGAYELPIGPLIVFERSAFSAWLTSPTVRPVFEYVTAAYYFVYFVVLPQYLFRSSAEVDYALSRFKRVFVVVLVIGAVDLALATAYGSNSWIWRHWGDGVLVEGRFHSLAGEPRQAFVYLFLGLAMLHLRAHQQGRRLGRWWVIAIVAAAMLTQSTTGIVAIAIFAGLWALDSVRKLSFKRIAQLSAGLVVMFALAYVAVVNSPRTLAYFHSAADLWYVLETGNELPYLMSKANSDIYPMYDLTVKARAGDVVPVLVGSGFGSASAVANRYYRASAGINNPHSQLARSLYETGLIGTFLYLMVFVRPVRAATEHLSSRTQREFFMLTLMLVACSLADRSSAPFSYVGTLAAAFRVWRSRS